MSIRWNAFYVLVTLFLAVLAPSTGRAQVVKPAAPVPPAAAATGAVIQRQETNATGIVAELTDCSRKDGVLSIKVRLHNTSAAIATFTVFEGNGDLPKFYVTAENKKYFILTDSEKAPLTTQMDAGYPWLRVKIAPGGSYQWWARYPAPPPSVKALAFYTAWTPPFDDVPITDK
jgi:hypothetical protein